MTKFDEQPLAMPGLDGGADAEIAKEDRQHAWLSIAVLIAKFELHELLATLLSDRGYNDERHLLAIILSDHGFDEKSVEFLLDCIAPKKVRGRRPGSPQEFWAVHLKDIKEELRADGHSTWGIHKDAMDQLEREAPEIQRSMLGFAPAFNREQLEAYLRRSTKHRSEKSRAK